MKTQIDFLRNGKPVSVGDFSPDTTVLSYLRLDERSCGTKEGCAEGDCGACTVAVGRQTSEGVVYEPINACIALLGNLEGKDLITVDDLAKPSVSGPKLHPVQQAMLDKAGSQCGFCTPGFVMSLWCLHQSDEPVERSQVLDQLAGNLCRCTGYRPIVEAGLEACNQTTQHQSPELPSQTQDVFVGSEERFFASPTSLEALDSLLASHPEATLVAGCTDVGLWITKHLQDLPKIISLQKLKALQTIEDTAEVLKLGAAVTYAEAFQVLGQIDADIEETLRRLGSAQIRAAGTIGGNIANGSPIGDTPPLLIALGASIELRKQGATREIELEDFFIEYGKQDLQVGEYVVAINIPKPKPKNAFRAFKISKRSDQDISAVMAAFLFDLDDVSQSLKSARLAFGGMAGTPKRAKQTEAMLCNTALKDLKPEAIRASLAQDFEPLSDVRASKSYRLNVAANCLHKAVLELKGHNDTRLKSR